MKDTKQSVLQQLRNQAKAGNKYLTDEYLNGLSPETLLNYTHPLYYFDNLRMMHKVELIKLN